MRELDFYLPALRWMRGYRTEDGAADAIAGTITAILLVPQAMAYALLAGLPPQVGLYASIVPTIVYALFASSRVLAVGPVAVASVMVATALAAAPHDTPQQAAASALVLALEGGVLLWLLAALRLGGLVHFLSHPVLSGFTSAAAVLILLSQLPALLGIAAFREPAFWPALRHLAANLETINWSTTAMGALALFALLLGNKPLFRWLVGRGVNDRAAMLGSRVTPVIVVVLSSAVVALWHLDSTAAVAVVGGVVSALPQFSLEVFQSEQWLQLLPSATFIALVGYVESVSMAKVVAFRRREKVNPNQELAALGASNVAAAFSGALPVAGGFARTMVNYHAGARSQAASIVAALWVALAVWLLAPAIAVIPRCVLAAVIIVAIVQLIDVGELRAAWRYDRSDALVLLVTFAAVLAAGVEWGLLSGAVCSYATQLWRVGKPHIAVVGRVPGTEHFRNVRRHNVLVWPNLLLVRPDESLSFANVSVVEDFIMAELARQPAVRHVVLLGNAVNHIDLSALESLTQLLENLRGAQVNVHLAEIKGPVMDRLGAVGFVGKLAPGQVFFRVDDAIDRLAAGEPQLIGPLGT